mmetsp:Transcript_36780/g.58960  ORF Transcript_36780/g.58960 Transcript_36780/m.58960 type:complete len:118 (-) Transcript_36780:621-974(-)
MAGFPAPLLTYYNDKNSYHNCDNIYSRYDYPPPKTERAVLEHWVEITQTKTTKFISSTTSNTSEKTLKSLLSNSNAATSPPLFLPNNCCRSEDSSPTDSVAPNRLSLGLSLPLDRGG